MIWARWAFTNILANGRRSSLAIGAIALAVAALILYGGYVNGVRFGLEYSTIHNGTGNLQVSGRGGFDGGGEQPLQFGMTPSQVAAVRAKAKDLDPVRSVTARVEVGGLVSTGSKTLSFAGLGISPEEERSAYGPTEVWKGKSLADADEPDAVVPGAEMARRLNVDVGQTVTLMTSTVSGALNAVDCVVVGLMKTGIPQSELYYLRVRREFAQSLLATDKVSFMTVVLSDDVEGPQVGSSLNGAAPGLEVRDWIALTPTYHQVVDMYEGQFRALGGFIILVTLMSIGIMILTSVLERSKEIGVMRALGIKRSTIRMAFTLEGLMLATLGLATGSILGAVVGKVADKMHLMVPPPPGRTTGYPLYILWHSSAVVVIWAAVLGLTIFTAWLASGRVARLRVMEALRSL